ncbi:MAG: pirin family protein [Acidimicrobiales bacterium]
MSGPVTEHDTDAERHHDDARPPCVEITDGRVSEVGNLPVARVLPKRERRTVGAWCFADHFGPSDIEHTPMNVGPHPHTGLQTVTWIVEGEVLHRDSLGSEQIIRPGQLNLMTAGHGVSHSEETPSDVVGDLHGVQLWIAQPDSTRDTAAAFEHHATLPQVELAPGARATILVGTFAGETSPARTDTPLVGADLLVESEFLAPIDPTFEHGLIVLEGAVTVDDREVHPGSFAYLGIGRDELHLRSDEHTRVMLIGGEPFEESIIMWWNFVGRSRDEVAQAAADWNATADRFGQVASPLDRIPAPDTPWS